MNIDFELYRIFYVVANNKSISKASKELLISQPAVTKSIKKLEDSLGGELFIRTKKGVTLTCEGEEIYYYIKQAIEFINNAENRFSNLKNIETGTIRIGISMTLAKNFLLPYLDIFHKKYPNIEIDINNHLTSDLISKLRKGTLDLVILHLPCEQSKDINIMPIKEINNCFVCNKQYINLTKKVQNIEVLSNYPLILQKKGSNTRNFLDDFSKENKITLTPKITTASYNLMIELVKIGFGIGFATKEYITKELNDKELYEIKINKKIPSRHIGIATLKNTIPNFATSKLIELIKNSQK